MNTSTVWSSAPSAAENEHADSNSQPAPTGNGPSVTDAVMEDLRYRREHGINKYGTELRANNGRDPLVDAYQEVLDLALYLKQTLMERDAAKNAMHDWITEND